MFQSGGKGGSSFSISCSRMRVLDEQREINLEENSGSMSSYSSEVRAENFSNR